MDDTGLAPVPHSRQQILQLHRLQRTPDTFLQLDLRSPHCTLQPHMTNRVCIHPQRYRHSPPGILRLDTSNLRKRDRLLLWCLRSQQRIGLQGKRNHIDCRHLERISPAHMCRWDSSCTFLPNLGCNPLCKIQHHSRHTLCTSLKMCPGIRPGICLAHKLSECSPCRSRVTLQIHRGIGKLLDCSFQMGCLH